ncbi:MAG TPA: hypothetical protein VEJ36_05180 [Nitrososphaerales archaeon]|nr:hypothetical protein [Nitrososphaerales archaeon]
MEQRIGFVLQKGRNYVIRGAVEGNEFESRHIGNENPHLYVFPEASVGNLEAGRKYELKVEAVVEKRKFEVLASTRGPCIRLGKQVLDGLGVRTEMTSVVELVLRKNNGTDRRVFGRWEPNWGFLQLYLKSAGYQPGETVELVRGRNYSADDFVRDVANEDSSTGLGLACDEVPSIRVGEAKLPIGNYRLVTHGLKASLQTSVGYGSQCLRLGYDGQILETKLGNSDRVIGAYVQDDCVKIRYKRTKNLAHVRSLQLATPKAAVIPDWLIGGLEVLSSPRTPEGVYSLRTEVAAGENARMKINRTRNMAECNNVRGDLAEDVVRVLGTRMGFDRMIDHPLAPRRVDSESRRRGPDFLVHEPTVDRWCYIEVKWWQDLTRATKVAFRQVRRYLVMYPEVDDIEVEGAYIAILDWNFRRHMRLLIEKAGDRGDN